MTFGGRRVPVSRPMMRTAHDEHKLPVPTYEYFADRDPLTRGCDGPDAPRGLDLQVPGRGRARPRGGRGAGERDGQVDGPELFVERTRTALGELMGRRLDDTRLAVMMLDGLESADRTHVVALGVSTEGVKVPLRLWEGSTENATLARSLLADLVDRGLDPGQAVLFVIDGGKAL
jgi:putative transposase